MHLYNWTPLRTPFFFVIGEWQHGHFFIHRNVDFRDFEMPAKL
jgi:hypothetical protein